MKKGSREYLDFLKKKQRARERLGRHYRREDAKLEAKTRQTKIMECE